EFFRASTDPRHTKVVYLLVLEGNDGEYGKKYYLLSQPVKEWTMKRASLAPFVKAMRLHLCINTDGNIFVWPIRLHHDSWSRSDSEVAAMAQSNWVRMYTPKNGRGHKCVVDKVIKDLPVFPTRPLLGKDGLIVEAFGTDFLICKTDHEVFIGLGERVSR